MTKDKRVIIVTGASRGVGKGTALAMAQDQCVVYVTGRSKYDGQTTDLPGNLQATVDGIKKRHGEARAIFCDHNDDAQIERMIEQVMDEQGHIDVLVNNVYQVPDDLLEWRPFWERPLNNHWAAMMGVGLRAHYVASRALAPHMVRRKKGMIATVSSPAVRGYIHSVIYGMGKAAKDKMMQDMAKELREFDVAALGLWPGIVRTERLQPVIDSDQLPESYLPLLPGMESPEFTGRILNAILNQDKALQYSGRSWWNSELAIELGVKDSDGKQPESYAPFMGTPVIPTEGMIK